MLKLNRKVSVQMLKTGQYRQVRTDHLEEWRAVVEKIADLLELGVNCGVGDRQAVRIELVADIQSESYGFVHEEDPS